MLDGLLGRGFAAKCKSLIKAMRARIELIRKKRIARERFLKKDIADLLTNELDINAYGRTEGLMKELTLSSCYDFVEQCCDLVYKQLSAMQKQSECPAECKGVVASLMFAAARVSDLPELRDLREAFQEKYGDSLQCFVNQKFIEDLSSPPPTMERKILLMQEIAAEYSISWNCRAFEKQLAKPPVCTQELPSRYGSAPVKDRIKADCGNSVNEKDKNHILSKVNHKPSSSDQNGSRARNGDGKVGEITTQSLGRQDVYRDGHMPHKGSDDKATKREDNGKALKVKESHLHKHQVQNITHGTTKPANVGISSNGREQDSFHGEHELPDIREVSMSKREMHQTCSLGRQVIHTPAEDVSSNVLNGGKLQDAHKEKPKSFSKMIPPPYVKPPKAVKAENKADMKYGGFNRNNAGSHPKSSHSIDTDDTHQIKYEKESSRPNTGMRDGHDDVQINQDEPKPKPERRRHSSRSSSSHDDVVEDLQSAKVEKRSSRSRRRSDTKRAMHILSGDEPRMKDEEKVLDKLLIHLSTKPTNIDPHKVPIEASGIRRSVENKVKPCGVSPLTPNRRSVSLPHEQTIPPVPANVIARAASLQPDGPAKHVHPNLPNCDDLAARIAALRSSH
ncbi:unnamed protein product [Rhodiola kirilowii]